MPQVIHEYATRVRGEDGTVYRVRACADEQPSGTWRGWLEFLPDDPERALATDEETSQPSLETTRYWAAGLEPVYLAGALARAQGRFATGLASDRIV